MLQFIQHILIVTAIFFVSFFAEAQGSPNLGDLFGKEMQAGACDYKKMKKEDIPQVDYKQIAAIGDELKYKKDYCRAVIYFKYARDYTSNAQERTQYWIDVIESFFYQYDYERFLEEITTFLEDRKGSAREEYVVYLLLKGLTELAKMDLSTTNGYLLYVLGASPDQFNPDSPKQIYKYRHFLEKYPNSKYTNDILSWYDEMKLAFNSNYANDVRWMVMKREYAPAISRFQFLLSQGPTNPDFTLLVFECINTMREFSSVIQDTFVVPSSRLARWMVTTEDKVDKNMRTVVGQKLIEQSNILFRNLVDKFPNDEWTKKAVKKFGMPPVIEVKPGQPKPEDPKN